MATRATVEPKIAAINDKGNNTALEVRTVLTELLNFSDEGLIQTNTKITNLETRAASIETVNNQQNNSINTINAKIVAIENINVNQTDRIVVLENKPTAPSLIPFHFWKPDPIIGTNQASLWHSFKGIKGQTVNFTFKIKIVENAIGNLFFPLDEEILKTIRFILDPSIQEQLSFVVAINNSENRSSTTGNFFNPRIWTAYLNFDDKGMTFNLFNLIEKNTLRSGDEIFTSIHFHCPEFKFDF